MFGDFFFFVEKLWWFKCCIDKGVCFGVEFVYLNIFLWEFGYCFDVLCWVEYVGMLEL